MNISEPCHHISFREEDFYVSFTPPFAVVFVSALTISEVTFLLSENDSLQVLLLILPTVVTVLCSCAVAFLCLRFKFGIGPNGVDCYDFWGRKHCTTWQRITGYRYVSLFGLDYLKIDIADERPVWLPLFVQRPTVLDEMLVTYSTVPLEGTSRSRFHTNRAA